MAVCVSRLPVASVVLLHSPVLSASVPTASSASVRGSYSLLTYLLTYSLSAMTSRGDDCHCQSVVRSEQRLGISDLPFKISNNSRI